MSTASPARDGRPNILVLMADQYSAHMMSCAGNPDVRTPNLDRLAAEGTRFTRAYTTFPLCVPARSSMVTGRYPHDLDISGNVPDDAAPEPARAPDSLGHLLSAAGYDCVYAGKWHARRPDVSPEDGFSMLAPFGDAGLAETCAAWLRARSATDAPFALFASFDDPHTICEYARGQPMPYGDVPPAPVRRAPPLPANFGSRPYEPEAVRFEQHARAAMYGVLGYRPDDWRQYRHVYARLVERVDGYVGVVLDALDRAGLRENTVVLFTSDHGDGDASHAWNQKTALFEETIRVPLLIRDPRAADPHPISGELVSVGLDLLPTLARIARARPPAGLPGTDLLPLMTGGASGRAEVVVQTLFERTQPPLTGGRALVTSGHKYVVYTWGRWREQLFDLAADPGETRNLAVEERHDALLEEMRAGLLQWCIDSGDTRFRKRLVLPASAPPSVAREIFAVPY